MVDDNTGVGPRVVSDERETQTVVLLQRAGLLVLVLVLAVGRFDPWQGARSSPRSRTWTPTSEYAS